MFSSQSEIIFLNIFGSPEPLNKLARNFVHEVAFAPQQI